MPEQDAEIAALVRAGPDLAKHSVVRWRCVDLSQVIHDRFGVHLAERNMGKAAGQALNTGTALVPAYIDKQAIMLHLAEISRAVARRTRRGLADRAGWHTLGGKLILPETVSALTLPPYSPELNPQRNIRHYLGQNCLFNSVFDTYTAIPDACCDTWQVPVNQPRKITSVASRKGAKTVTVQARWYNARLVA